MKLAKPAVATSALFCLATLMVGLGGIGAASPPAVAADKPLWKVKGNPTGPVLGGTDGTPFKDKARGRLAAVTVRSGAWIDSIRCSYEDEGTIEKGDLHGGEGGDEAEVKLEPGETLIGVFGVFRGEGPDRVIGSVGFKTTKRTVEPIGKTTDGEKFALDAPTGQEICGFQGRSGDYLSAIGMVCRPWS